ncbi:MAG: hypothetical protein KKA32_10365 [Actinobacteria bacterium]|nr:hypothetical protein [Actinomycetota bacterium]
MAESNEAGEIARAVAEQLGSLVPVVGVKLVIQDPEGPFHEAYSDGVRTPGVTPLELCGGDSSVLQNLIEHRAVVLEPAGAGASNGRGASAVAGVRSGDGAAAEAGPELQPGCLLGVFDGDGLTGVLALWIAQGHSLEPYRGLLARLSLQLSPTVRNTRLYERMKALHLSTLKGLSTALNAKDYYTLGHAARVATYVVLLLRELGWKDRLLGPSADAALLHDIGKLGISDRVLPKQGPLTSEEWDLMRQHPIPRWSPLSYACSAVCGHGGSG